MRTLRFVGPTARRTLTEMAGAILLLTAVALPAGKAQPMNGAGGVPVGGVPVGGDVIPPIGADIPPAPPPGLLEKANTFSIGEVFLLGPDPFVGPLKAAYVSRSAIVQTFPIERGSSVVRVQDRGARRGHSDARRRQRQIPPLHHPHFTQPQLPADTGPPAVPQDQRPSRGGGDNILIADGTVESPGESDALVQFLGGFVERGGQVINRMKVTGIMQVQLQVCIAKVDRTAMRNMGVNFLRGEQSNFEGSQIGNLIGVPNIAAHGGTAGNATGVFSNFNGSGTNSVLSPNATVFFGITPNNVNFFAFIEALKQEGVAKILATPTLVTLNGRPADFLVGGEQPVPVVTGTGSSLTPSVDYKPFGTRLTFVPIILGDGKIRLNIVPEVSQLTSNTVLVAGTLVPQFETQRLNATVEMESGQTLALGGLLQTEEDATVNKIPILGDLPGAGVLFRRITYNKIETELLIVVTPTLVDPLHGCQRPPALPGQESRTPTTASCISRARSRCRCRAAMGPLFRSRCR